MVREGRWASLKATFLRGVFPAPLFRWNRLRIERISLAGARQAPPLDRRTLRVQWAGPGDTGRLLRVRDKPEAFERSFRDGHWCALGQLDGEPATMSWVETADWHVSRTNAYRMKLPAGAGWHIGSFVREDLRGQGLYAHHTLGLLRMLHAEGLRELYCAVEADNAASRRAHERVGYEPLFELRVLRLLGLTLCAVEDRRRPEPRGLALRLGPWVHRPDAPESA
jgi:RimJ/RimL family protein N-acetyltransferase